MQSTKIAIEPDGAITMIYSDDAAELLDHGAAVIRRVSNVEPDAHGHWWATMVDKREHLPALPAPCPRGVLRHDGTVQMGPFKLRAEALDAEIAYLEAQLF